MVAKIGSRSSTPSKKRSAISLMAALGSVAVSVTDARSSQTGVEKSRQQAVYRLEWIVPSTEQVGQQGRRRLLQLVIAAVGGRLVRPPALEGGRVAETVSLQVIEGDLAH